MRKLLEINCKSKGSIQDILEIVRLKKIMRLAKTDEKGWFSETISLIGK